MSLLERYQRNRADLDALISFLEVYGPKLYGTIRSTYRISGPNAEELLQEVSEKIRLKLPANLERTRLAPWVHTITRNLCLNWLRRRKHSRHHFVSLLHDAITLDEGSYYSG